jgi:hypothetical protein
MKKNLILSIVLAFFAINISFAQSVLIQPNNINSRQSSSTDNLTLQGTNPPNIVGIRHDGTLSSPTATGNGDFPLSLDARGHTGSGFTSTKGRINFETTQPWTAAANGLRIDFHTTPNGSTAMARRMTINHDGKIGIGTTIAPTAKLQIEHNGTDTDPHLRLHSTGSYSRINWTNTANSNVWTAQSYLESATAASNYWRLEYNGIANFYVKGDGDVGLGTSAPDSKLHVVGSDNNGTTATIKITSGSQNMLIDGNEIDALATDMYLQNNTNADLIMVNGGGNVGIGTTTPNNKLDVLGTIRANEVIVETGWADYVFEDSFKLKSLDEVESFIKENKHLPDVPSAKTIQEKGAHVAELMTKMMQKIEELTLYSIKQQKEIEALKAKLELK